MTWFTDRHYFLIAVCFYGISSIYSIFLLRRGFREDNRINYCLLAGAFAFHTFAMFKRGFSLERCPINNLYEATTFLTWTIVAIYLLIGAWSKLRFLGAFASPILFAISIFALMPSLDVHATTPNFTGGLASLHKALILLAYGAFGLSSVAGIMYLTQEHDLKYHKMRAIFSLLPPIQRLELILGRMLGAGFLLLTSGLIVSSIFLKQTRNVYFTNDAEMLYSAFVWLLYLGLLISRWRFAQRGRRFAWGAVGGFAFVMLTFWGIYLLSGIHTPRDKASMDRLPHSEPTALTTASHSAPTI
ncbi:MAG TPA: cytochrome c biogenesis protein CcsA [Candidatus Saccharimonadales bacterium]|nr:cytochrome c biogenesis protein CcsA [Candidatus Saccharimonadales bacterium]